MPYVSASVDLEDFDTGDRLNSRAAQRSRGMNS